MIVWERCPPLRSLRVRFLSSDGHVHDVKSSGLNDARKIDPELRVLATTPEEWIDFLVDQKLIERHWALRNIVTDVDTKMLQSMGIKWGRPAHWGEEPVNLYSLRGDEE